MLSVYVYVYGHVHVDVVLDVDVDGFLFIANENKFIARPTSLTVHTQAAIFKRDSGLMLISCRKLFLKMIERPGNSIIAPPGLERTNGSALFHPRWYALYTRSRFEKKMLSELTDRGVEVFLPMRETISRWKDRKKRIWLPLFPGYIFVNHVDTPENRYRILNMPGAVRFVGIEGHADPVPEEQILDVRRFLESSISIDPYPYMQVGTRVEVIAGPLKGIRGLLVEKRGKFRFVLQVDLIRQAISVEIDASDIRPV